MLNKKVLLTFDYELFLGEKSGSVQNSILSPNKLLLDLLKKHNIKNAIFFVDTMFLFKLKSIIKDYPKAEKDYNEIIEQLRTIIKDNHYIFPHIHPHWLDAVYLPEINQWELLDFSKYRFNSIDEKIQSEIFTDSVNILKEIILPVDEKYIIDSYRAGGWCLQPFSDFKPLFIKFNIKNDFSVLPGMYYYSEVQHYDFVGFPDKPIYSFNDDPQFQENGPYREYSISILSFPSWVKSVEFYFKKILWKMNIGYMGDGIGVVSESLEKQTQYSKGMYKEMASIELLTFIKLYFYFKRIKNNDYLQLISHPKMFSKYNMWCFELFIKRIKSKYNLEFDFRNFKNE